MSWVTIIIALALAFVAWKVLVGLVKFAAIALILLVGVYVLSQGGFAL